MAQRERALVALSDTLGSLANNQMNREHERIQAMRQENFMRLQHMLGEESRAADRAARKDELTTEMGLRRDLFKEETAARKELAAQESTARQAEGAADRASREKIAGMEIGAQEKRWEREDIRAYDSQYLTRTNAIDKRIQELNDYKVQAQAEGKLVDNSYLTQVDQELTQLTEQKRSLAQERDLMLARGGDQRYRKLSAEEVANLKKRGQDPGTGATTSEDMPMAAQGPREPTGGGTSIKVPQAPPKPPGMVAREERKITAGRGATNLGPVQQDRMLVGGGRGAFGKEPPSLRAPDLTSESSQVLKEKLRTADRSEAIRIRLELQRRGEK